MKIEQLKKNNSLSSCQKDTKALKEKFKKIYKKQRFMHKS